MPLEAFVSQEFGLDASRLLQKMQIGGANNAKGTNYELQFTAAKIFEIAARETDLDDYLISRQEAGFVDDIVIRCESSRTKWNYQAKNSEGSTAKWSAAHEKNFERQRVVDEKFHGYPNNFQILLVPDQSLADRNNTDIPKRMASYATSEFHPIAETTSGLLYANKRIRSHLARVCGSDDLSDLDSAFRLMLSVSMCNLGPKSVGDLVGEARAISKPDLFAGTIPKRPPPPGWLLDKCNDFEGMVVELKFGSYRVAYEGFEVTVGADIATPERKVIEELSSPLLFMTFLISTLQHQLK